MLSSRRHRSWDGVLLSSARLIDLVRDLSSGYIRRQQGEEAMDNLERVGRVELAAAFRLAVRFGMHEGIDNHFSLALSDDGREFLVNPYGRHFSELRASDLLRVNTEGAVLSGGGEIERSALYIHGRMHAARPDVRCILHTHMPYATALTSVEGARLEPIHQNALRFIGQIAYDDAYGGLALDAEEGDRLAAVLGEMRTLFMANHGVATTGPSVAAAFDDLYFLERACRNQVLAMSTGRPLKPVSADEVARTRAEFDHYQGHAEVHFAALRRILDRDEPDYAE
jgi:ribulose-5-phosphate 4-epimerase/fuculose-1-phosphate aldolase